MRGANRRQIVPLHWLMASVFVVLATGSVCAAQFKRVTDTVGDVRIRRVDGVSAQPGLPAGHRMPDIISYEIGSWAPNDPVDSLFRGVWSNAGEFFRIDLTFDGLVNPPGTLMAPFLFGPNPVFGFIEIDMDGNADTGGELALTNFRYLGAAARFGGVPSKPRFSGRTALDMCPGNFDGDITTGPYFAERSGEDFHIFLVHSDGVTINTGSNGNLAAFEADDQWLLTGPFLERANGYEEFSLAIPNGSYVPIDSRLLWQHVASNGFTIVSLVSPLTNVGSAAMRGEDAGAPEPLDGDVTNQSSVLEGLDDLTFSTVFASLDFRNAPNFPIIADWELQAAGDYLDPLNWKLSVILMGFFFEPAGAKDVLAFTDIVPNVKRGDFNGNNIVNQADINLFNAFLTNSDGSVCDENGTSNGVGIVDFGNNFNVYDVNYDGIVDANDRPVLTAVVAFDADLDGDVDLADFALMQICFTGPGGGPIEMVCERLDADGDGDIDAADLSGFVTAIQGPKSTSDIAPWPALMVDEH